VSLVLGVTAALLLCLLALGAEPRGLVQRATVACELVWLIALALRLCVEGQRVAIRAAGASPADL
jgi:hypothetical protein